MLFHTGGHCVQLWRKRLSVRTISDHGDLTFLIDYLIAAINNNWFYCRSKNSKRRFLHDGFKIKLAFKLFNFEILTRVALLFKNDKASRSVSGTLLFFKKAENSVCFYLVQNLTIEPSVQITQAQCLVMIILL